ncbi:MAG: hypothetical protein HUU55_09750 [Myxococcales bacterium]|nr:hypothetical protein [Myxococcales bacterium]
MRRSVRQSETNVTGNDLHSICRQQTVQYAGGNGGFSATLVLHRRAARIAILYAALSACNSSEPASTGATDNSVDTIQQDHHPSDYLYEAETVTDIVSNSAQDTSGDNNEMVASDSPTTDDTSDTLAPPIDLELVGKHCAGWEVSHTLTLGGDLIPVPDVLSPPPGHPGHISPFAYGIWTLVANSAIPEINVYCLGSALVCGREQLHRESTLACENDDTGYCVLAQYMAQCRYRVTFIPWDVAEVGQLPAQSYRCVRKVSATTGKATQTPACIDVFCDNAEHCGDSRACATITPDDGIACYVSSTKGGICCGMACVDLGDWCF